MPANEHVATKINRYLKRFPLILDILEEIHETPHIGDEDLKHGSLRAMHTILGHLRKIEPVDSRNPLKAEASEAEQIAREWLLGERPRTLLPGPVLNELESLICGLLPEPLGHRKEQAS